MKTWPAAILVCLWVLVAGCVSPRTTQPPAAGVDFRQYPKVTLVVSDAVNTPYSKAGLPLFEGLLRGRLEAMGYLVTPTDGSLNLTIRVVEFSPGDRALRALVGFGAGRAVFKYTARFEEASGRFLAELEGGKSYHGMEVVDNPTFKSDEATRMGLVSYSVSQIGRFIENHGARAAP
ncbi:MAG: DUF4410 domain-containing protein [Verrucomicrobiota bacterium]